MLNALGRSPLVVNTRESDDSRAVPCAASVAPPVADELSQPRPGPPGGFRHGQHLAFDAQNNYPLTNLFVSMLQRLGLEVDKFASSKGTLTGLEMAG